MNSLIIISLDELEHRFKQGYFQPIENCISFSELFPLFLLKLDDTIDHKIAVWEHIENKHDDLLVYCYYDVFDLMLDFFHEVLFNHIKSILGVTLDDLQYEVVHTQGNTIYLEIPNGTISKLYHPRYKTNNLGIK